MRCAFPKLILGATVATGLTAFSHAAVADDIIIFQDVPSADEINNVLFGNENNALDGQRTRSIRVVEPSLRAIENKTRAIRMHNPEHVTSAETGAQNVAAATGVPAEETSGVGLGFNLQFAFDSVELLPDSEPYIDRLGEVLGAEENQEKVLLILGHTDAIGSEAYNAVLSENRAISVKNYLTTTWNIDADRLQIQGAGETQPLEGTDPNGGVNRRVEFYAVN